MPYAIEYRRSAADDLEAVPRSEQQNIRRRIDRLSETPRPRWAIRLTGRPGCWRFRVGAYRVVYEILDRDRRIIVVRVGARGDVYRER